MKNQIQFIRHALSLSLVFITSFSLHAQNCPPVIQWEESLGGSQDDRASSVLVTSDGGYLVAGYTASNDSQVVGNHGEQDIWVIKLTADGSPLWQKVLGGGHSEVAHDAVESPDGAYLIAGSTRSNNGNVSGNHGSQDYWVVKVSTDGALVWQAAYGGGGNDLAFSIANTNDGGSIVAGLTYSFDGQVTTNHGADDYWVVKIDTIGAVQWQESFGGSGKDEAHSVIQTDDGGYLIAGSTESNNGDVTGNHGGKDYWLVKLDANGFLLWEKAYGGPQDDVANSVRQTIDGGYVIAGYTGSSSGDVTFNHGASDYWIVKIDSAGTITWEKSLGGSDLDQPNEIEETNDGGYVSIGSTLSLNGDVMNQHGMLDFWITKQDASGNLLWQKTLGGTNNDGGLSIKETPDTGFIAAGYSNSFNDDVTGNHGGDDFWVVKLLEDPTALVTYYADQDSDGYGDPNNSIEVNACTIPIGYVTDNTDCNDADSLIHPDAVENCNGLDDNCNNVIDEGVTYQTFYQDVDSDGYGNPSVTVVSCTGAPAGYVSITGDCDDANAAVHPGATEVCNGVDDNCNFQIDEGGMTYYADVDNDSYGDPFSSTVSCSGAPYGYVTDSTDCNDADGAVNPGATEVCNGIDDNCNFQIDEGLASTYYADVDSDGFGDASVSIIACSQPIGYVADNTDCNDADHAINPGAAEVCNGIDDNCNLLNDDGLTYVTYFLDADSDTYGDFNNSVSTCSGTPSGYVVSSTDCNDADGSIHPGATEFCNGIDDNCNFVIDEGVVNITYYHDADSDSYGNALDTLTTCAGQPVGYVLDSTDCDDTNPDVNPGVLEVSNNGIDDDCDGYVDEFGVGISDPIQSSIVLFPNPANDVITVQFDAGLACSACNDFQIRISNVLGQIVFDKVVSPQSRMVSEEISLAEIQQGVYMLELIAGQQHWTSPFVVAR